MLHNDQPVPQSNLLNTLDAIMNADDCDLDRTSAIIACVFIIDNHFIDNVEYALGYLRITGEEYRDAGGGYL